MADSAVIGNANAAAAATNQATIRAFGSRPMVAAVAAAATTTARATSVPPGVARLPANPAPPVTAQTMPAVPRRRWAAEGRTGGERAAPRPVTTATPRATQEVVPAGAPVAAGATT